jgi:protein-glutamine gamma-glutamyltransferase
VTDRATQQRDRIRQMLPTVRNGLRAARHIPLQRWLALAIITLESVAVGYLSQTLIYPAMVVCVAAYGTLSHLRFQMDRQRTYDVIALMAVIFVIKYMLTPDNPRYASLFPSQQLAFALAQYVLAMQCVQFFLKRRDDRLPASFPGIGVIALVCTTMVSLAAGERSVMQGLCVGFVVLSVLYCDASRRFVKVVPARRRGRPIATVLVLAAVGSLGWLAASSMYHYERHVEEFVNRFLQQQSERTSVGFSESSTLGSVSLKKDINSQQTALRVVAAVEPGYFRAKAYDVYENRKWLLNTEGHAIRPERITPDGVRSDTHNGRAFQISAAESPGGRQFEVWPDADLGDNFAGPLQTSWLYADASIVTVDTHNIIRSSDAATGVPYTLIVRDDHQPLPRNDASDSLNTSQQALGARLDLEQLATPPKWATSNPRLVKLAESIYLGSDSVQEKIQAVHQYFDQNYSYSLKVTPPISLQQEPLEWFLLSQPAGHCEYFASGTAVLLRMAGVPCRYVVGFVISEQNRYSGEWVARNEDAHAWVEAYDDTRGWVTVDTTPGAGIPDDAAVSSSTQLYEYLRDEFHRLRIGWQQRGVAALLTSLNAFIASPVGRALLTGMALLLLGIVFWRRRRRIQSGHTSYVTHSPVVLQLQAARVTLDKAVRRAWRSRQPGETVSRYAQQLATGATSPHDPLTRAAAWYEQYAELRFAPSPNESLVGEISAQANKLAAELRRRVRQPDKDLRQSVTDLRAKQADTQDSRF